MYSNNNHFGLALGLGCFSAILNLALSLAGIALVIWVAVSVLQLMGVL